MDAINLILFAVLFVLQVAIILCCCAAAVGMQGTKRSCWRGSCKPRTMSAVPK